MTPKTAVILAAGLGTRMGGRPKGLVRVAGREILYRTMHLLQRNGVERFVIVTNERYAPLYREFVEMNGFNAELVINPEPEKGNGHSLHLAKGHLSGRFVLVMSDHVYSEAFVVEAIKGNGLIADRRPGWIDVDEATKVKVKDGRVERIGKGLKDWDAVDTGFFVLDEGIFRVTEGLENEKNGDYSLSEVVERAKLPVTFVDGLGWTDVDTPEELKRARKMLVFTAVKGTGDGFISRHLNRKISTRISYLLVEKVTPNQMTVVTFALGVLSAFLTLVSLPLAGILYQLSSILDGVDGELARAQLRTSRLGGYVDSILDRYVDGSFLALLAYSALKEPLWYLVALLALLGSVMVSYSTERFKGAFCRDAYWEVSALRKLPGKRDERVFLTMLFLLVPSGLAVRALFALLAVLTNLRVGATVYLVSRKVSRPKTI
ncbi:1L-myo-inositol-1-phosphate cytidylyltransferase / CDP-L-myo-inositol myo-inositolphosphotransferase [Thermococcus nautili]|uniref:bifunctional L-myo-inositol-1-phosphate cytidylyltransferase/CDP-L-myo-inositol myo-inositolphosphotransferase n=1 Tax=Thermococcus nautili TaxID=195522 RepID=UPI002557A03C|nr:bifunctional L-myo-inositol-1-phosphate cytidylyltransferase/CDP-L-myo-inositol myo-inositolphosphotransferase [Thermococcus nautili]CAI1493131.1 1L-myo-inositol-1-phosphate cytidylyltransferase / CDP-L-myo-inositol myo-inositolphosphotransferase [Thermococcus nautili]